MKTLRRNIVVAAAAAALVSVPATAMGAGFANTAHSATATGMGTLGVANPGEGAMNFYNPAAMGFAEELSVYGGATLLLPSADYTHADGEITSETPFSVFTPPNLDATVPLGDSFAAGVSVAFPWGLGVEWPDDWHGRETFQSQSLETLNVNPNVAYHFEDADLSVAAGVQLMRAAMEQRRVVTLRDDTEADIHMGGLGHGIGASLSAQYRPTEELTVGASYRSATRMSFTGNIHFGEEVNETPYERRMIDQGITTSITIPHTVNAGIGYDLTEELWLGFEANYMTWSTYDEVRVEFDEQSPEGEPGEREPDLVQAADWHDAVALRLGGQYQVMDNLAVRGGTAVDMTPVPDSTVGPSLPDNNRFIFAGGLGYEQDALRVDLAYQFIMLPQRVIDRDEPIDGSYQMRSHVMGLSLGYGF